MKQSIYVKVLIVIILLGLVGMATGFLYSRYTSKKLVAQQIEERIAFLKNDIAAQINKKKDIGLTNAIGFAANRYIHMALKDQDREFAHQVINEIGDLYRSNSNFKGIKLHLHNTDLTSFIRSWNRKIYGDDLKTFRHSLKNVISKKRGWSGFEAGIAGLVIRGIVPVIENGTSIGSLEFIQGVGSVSRDFKKADRLYIMLADEKSADISASLKKNVKIDRFYVSNMKWFTDEVVNFAKSLDYEILLSQGYVMTTDRFVTFEPVIDFQGKQMGIHVIGENLEILKSGIAVAKRISSSYLMLIAGLMIVVVLFMMYAIHRLVLSPLSHVTTGLTDFFRFLNKEQEDADPIRLSSSDEIGKMAAVINDNMVRTKKLFLYDNKVATQNIQTISEVEAMVKQVQNGFYQFELVPSTEQKDFALLVKNFNRLIVSTRQQFERISQAILSFSESNFTIQLQAGQSSGSMGGLISSINTLGVSISELMAFIFNIGEQLEKSAGNGGFHEKDI